ncbi:MAG: LolA-like protein [Planctomycetota bacterium]
MRRATCVAFSVLIECGGVHACAVTPEELTDPVEILKRADAAARAVTAVKYDVVVEEAGALSPCLRPGELEATFLVVADVEDPLPKFRVDVKMTPPGASQPQRLSGGGDGDTFFIVNHQSMMAYEDLDPAVMGPSAGVFVKAGLAEFLAPTPFADEISGKTQELVGSAKIHGEDCYEVRVVYGRENAPDVVWSFSKRDFLPRRRVDLFGGTCGAEGKITKTITNVVVDPKLDEDTFKLRLPEGYAKTDDFAPDFLTAKPAAEAEAQDGSRRPR